MMVNPLVGNAFREAIPSKDGPWDIQNPHTFPDGPTPQLRSFTLPNRDPSHGQMWWLSFDGVANH